MNKTEFQKTNLLALFVAVHPYWWVSLYAIALVWRYLYEADMLVSIVQAFVLAGVGIGTFCVLLVFIQYVGMEKPKRTTSALAYLIVGSPAVLVITHMFSNVEVVANVMIFTLNKVGVQLPRVLLQPNILGLLFVVMDVIASLAVVYSLYMHIVSDRRHIVGLFAAATGGVIFFLVNHVFDVPISLFIAVIAVFITIAIGNIRFRVR